MIDVMAMYEDNKIIFHPSRSVCESVSVLSSPFLKNTSVCPQQTTLANHKPFILFYNSKYVDVYKKNLFPTLVSVSLTDIRGGSLRP